MELKYSEIIDLNTNKIRQSLAEFLKIKPHDIKKKIALEIVLTDTLLKAQEHYNTLRISWLDEHATETEYDGKPTKFEVREGKLTNSYNLTTEAMDVLRKKLEELGEQTIEVNFEPFTEEEIQNTNYQQLDFNALRKFIKFNEI